MGPSLIGKESVVANTLDDDNGGAEVDDHDVECAKNALHKKDCIESVESGAGAEVVIQDENGTLRYNANCNTHLRDTQSIQGAEHDTNSAVTTNNRYRYSKDEMWAIRSTLGAVPERKINLRNVRKRRPGTKIGILNDAHDSDVYSVDELLGLYSPQQPPNQRHCQTRGELCITDPAGLRIEKSPTPSTHVGLDVEHTQIVHEDIKREEEEKWNNYAEWAYSEGYRIGYQEAYNIAKTLSTKLNI